MLFQVLLNVFFFLLKIAIWIAIALAAIPLGFFLLFSNFFPDFTSDAGFGFWLCFGIVNIIAYYFLWRPIVWTITGITVLFEGA